jgi:hypothetical protein
MNIYMVQHHCNHYLYAIAAQKKNGGSWYNKPRVMRRGKGCSEEESGHPGMNTSTLLGDKKIIKETIEYIEKTGRFELER